MDTKGVVTALVVCGLVVVGGFVWSQEREKQHGEMDTQIVAMAMAATVPIDQAIKIALDNYPGRVVEAEMEKKHDRTVWEVEIVTAERRIMVVQIDAESGSVIDTEEKAAGMKYEQDGKGARPGAETR